MNFKVRRPIFRLKHKIRFRIFFAAAFVLLLALLISTYNRIVTDKVREPVILEAEEEVSAMIISAVREYLSEKENFTRDCFTSTVNTNGNSVSYSVNAELINAAEAEIVARLREKLERCSVISVNIPVGTLISNQYFSGKGFPVKVKVYLSTSVGSNVSSNIESVGINQSLYKLSLNINVEGELIFPGGSEKFTVSSSSPLGEKIIMGGVPLS